MIRVGDEIRRGKDFPCYVVTRVEYDDNGYFVHCSGINKWGGVETFYSEPEITGKHYEYIGQLLEIMNGGK